MTKVYKSKIGPELVIPLILIFGVVLLLNINQHSKWLGIVILFPAIIFVVHMFLSTHYTIDDDRLIIKSGFLFNKTIDIRTIKKVSETNNLLSSPATSIDRLEITYDKFDSVLISPKHKKEFIHDITTINPNIEVKLKKKRNS